MASLHISFALDLFDGSTAKAEAIIALVGSRLFPSEKNGQEESVEDRRRKSFSQPRRFNGSLRLLRDQ